MKKRGRKKDGGNRLRIKMKHRIKDGGKDNMKRKQ
jgi:hypothetical protein